MNIKKKLLAITLVCAIASSFAACSDKTNQNGSGSQGKVKADVQATLSSEEIQSLEKQDLTITPFNESSDNQEDPVENSNSNDSSENNVNNNFLFRLKVYKTIQAQYLLKILIKNY